MVIFARISLFLLILNTVVGVFWIFQNFIFVPQYGDTIEYVRRSKMLEVDQYRGVFYPALLFFSSVISPYMKLPVNLFVYLFQIFFALFSIYALVILVLESFSASKERAMLICIAVGCSPLVAHFSISLMADSLATSFTIIFICYLTRGCLHSTLTVKRYTYLAFATVAFVLMASTRIEKFHLGILIFLGCLAAIFMINRHGSMKKTLVSSIVAASFLVTGVGTVLMIKKETTVYNVNRPPLDIQNMAFNRVVWPRMSNVYQFLPDTLKAQITLKEAVRFDSHANNVYPFIVKTLRIPDGQSQINTVTLLTFQHFPIQVIGNILFDFGKYTAPNFAFPLEMAKILPRSWATSWTISRMEMFSPRLSRVYLIIGGIQFLFSISFLFTIEMQKCFARKKSGLPMFDWQFAFQPPYIFLVSGAVILLNSAMFTLFAGMEAHIRYALPTYTIFQTIVVVLTVTRAFSILGDEQDRKRRFVGN